MERESRGCTFNAAATTTGICLAAGVFNGAKGLYLSKQLGGLERVSQIGSQIVLEAQKVNIDEALALASTYPNEMSAILSFGIAAVCGIAAAGSTLGYAYIEAHNQD